MVHAAFLEEVHHIGHPKHLTPFQIQFKKEGGQLSGLALSGHVYTTEVAKWTCTCDALKYNSFHLFKHLVQAVLTAPINFFCKVVCSETVPLYQHPALHCQISTVTSTWTNPDDGLITDGDDHLWLGDTSMLNGSKWWELLKHPILSLGKRKSSIVNDARSDFDPDMDSGPECDDTPAQGHSHQDVVGSDDEEEVRTHICIYFLH
ncbi:hypothetical protein K439DRAFT_1368764 [Ramaria rubella]|nr:hypothetical protein K439DRAFT_1368764 [Ramaria rubella]